jgi:hypothetical protein
VVLVEAAQVEIAASARRQPGSLAAHSRFRNRPQPLAAKAGRPQYNGHFPARPNRASVLASWLLPAGSIQKSQLRRSPPRVQIHAPAEGSRLEIGQDETSPIGAKQPRARTRRDARIAALAATLLASARRLLSAKCSHAIGSDGTVAQTPSLGPGLRGAHASASPAPSRRPPRRQARRRPHPGHRPQGQPGRPPARPLLEQHRARPRRRVLAALAGGER